jgi:threonine dehydrogenase-like Zn-dependent dehydrogenase
VVGEVAALGPGTERSGLAAGYHVVAENHAGCNACPMCRSGRYNLCQRVREPGFRLVSTHPLPAVAGAFAALKSREAIRPIVTMWLLPGDAAMHCSPG